MWPNGIIYKDVVALAINSTFASLPVDVLDDSLRPTILMETNKHVMEGLSLLSTELANTSNATYC